MKWCGTGGGGGGEGSNTNHASESSDDSGATVGGERFGKRAKEPTKIAALEKKRAVHCVSACVERII